MAEFNEHMAQMGEALSRGINIHHSNNQHPKQTMNNDQQVQSVLDNTDDIFEFEYPTFDAISIAVASELTKNNDDYHKTEFMKKIKSLYNNAKHNKEYQKLMVFAYKMNPHVMTNKELLININDLLKNDMFEQELFARLSHNKEYIYRFTTELGHHLNQDELTKLNQINDVLNDENTNHKVFVISELFKKQDIEPLVHYLQSNQNYDSDFFEEIKKGIEHYLFKEETDALTFVDNPNQMIKNMQALYTKKEQTAFLTNMAEKIKTTIETNIDEQSYDVLQLIHAFNKIKRDLPKNDNISERNIPDESKANENITKYFAQATSTIIKNTDNSLLPFNHMRLAINIFANVDGFIDNDILKKAISYSGYMPSEDKYNIGENVYPLAEILDMEIKIDDEIKDFAIAINGVNGAIIGLSNLSEQQKQQLLQNNDLIGNINLLAYDTMISSTSLRKHANDFLDELKNHPEFVTRLLKTSPYNLPYIQLTKIQFDELAYDILATNAQMIPQLHQGKNNVYFSNIGEFMFDKQSRVFNEEFSEKMNDVIADKIRNNIEPNTASGKWTNIHFQYLNNINDNLLNVLLDTNALSRLAQKHPHEDDLIQLTHPLKFNENQQRKIIEHNKDNFISISNPTDEVIIDMLDKDKNLVLKNHNATNILSSIINDNKEPSYKIVTDKLIATIEKDWKFGKELVETLCEYENTDLLEAIYQGIIKNEPASKHKEIIKDLSQEDGVFDGWEYDEYYDKTHNFDERQQIKIVGLTLHHYR